MKKWVLLCAAALLFSGMASAQDFPRVEAFGGYSYAHLSADSVSSNLNGGSASVAYNLYSWLGVVGDFGGYHGDANFGNANLYSYLFGPKIALRHGPITPFVQALFGGAHASATVDCEDTARIRSQDDGCGSVGENSFAMTVGGGLDWNATPHIGVRLIQAEYFMTNFASTRENGARISAGVVFRF
jgi:opacity protein-like surface antigen